MGNEKGLSPKKIQQLDMTQIALENLNSEDESDHNDTFDEDDENVGKVSSPDGKDLNDINDNGDNDSLGEDMKRLFSITDDNNDHLKDWSFTESTLGRADFDAIDSGGKKDASGVS